MRNYLIGVLSGLAGCLLYTMAPQTAWYFWMLFVAGCLLIAFSFDVFFGSLKENQPRAAWLGLLIFGGSGAVFQVLVWTLGT